MHDLARATRFYREVFDWPQTVDAPVYAELLMPDGRRLGLYVAAGYGRNTGVDPTLPPPRGVSPAELYFHTEDPSALIARLTAAGARCSAPSHRVRGATRRRPRLSPTAVIVAAPPPPRPRAEPDPAVRT